MMSISFSTSWRYISGSFAGGLRDANVILDLGDVVELEVGEGANAGVVAGVVIVAFVVDTVVDFGTPCLIESDVEPLPLICFDLMSDSLSSSRAL